MNKKTLIIVIIMVVIALGVGVFAALSNSGSLGANTGNKIQASVDDALKDLPFVTDVDVKTYASNLGEQESNQQADSAAVTVLVDSFTAANMEALTEALPKSSIQTLYQVTTNEGVEPHINVGVFTKELLEEDSLSERYGTALTCIADTPDNADVSYDVKASQAEDGTATEVYAHLSVYSSTVEDVQTMTSCFSQQGIETVVTNATDKEVKNVIQYSIVKGDTSFLEQYGDFAETFAYSFMNEETEILVDGNTETGQVIITVTELGERNSPETVQAFVDKYSDLDVEIQDAATVAVDEDGNPIELENPEE